MGLSAVVLLYIGRGQVIRADTLNYAARLGTEPLGDALFHTPPNKYLIAPPLLLYYSMFQAFGLAADLPYRIITAALVLVCAGLFFVLARRRVGDWLALPPTFMLLVFGAGWETVLTAIRIPSLIAVAAGLAGLIALERRDRRGDIGAALALTVAVASHPVGLSFLAASMVLIATRPSPQRWRSAWIPAIPAAVFAAWWLFLRAPTTAAPFSTHPRDVVNFAVDSWTMLVASVSGLAGVVPHPAFGQTLAQLAAALLAGVILASLGMRFRRVPPSLWAALTALLVLLISTRLAPNAFTRSPDAPRYLYPEGVLFLLVLTEVAAVVELRRWGAAAAAAILALGLAYNFNQLRDGGTILRRDAEVAVGQYTAYEIAGSRLQASYQPEPISPNAGTYIDAAEAYGSAAETEAELVHDPLAMRQAADAALVGSLGVGLDPSPRTVRAGGHAPRMDRILSGRVLRTSHCVRMIPPAARTSKQTMVPVDPTPSPKRALKAAIRNEPVKPIPVVPVLGELSVRPGELRISTAGKISRVAVLLGKFALPPSAQLDQVYGSHQATLRLPAAASTRPWVVAVGASDPVSICTVPTT
jgi:hypothetical protein